MEERWCSVHRVYLMAPEFGAIDGVAEQVTTLATELARRGIDTRVFIRRPCRPDNQYLRRLKTEVPIVQPPRSMAFLGRVDWAARDRMLQRVVSLAMPLLILAATITAAAGRRPFKRTLRGGRGYLNRVLGKLLLPDYLDRIFHLQLAWHVWRHRPDVVEISRSDYVWQVNWFYQRGLPTVYREHGTRCEWTSQQIQNLRRAACVIAVSKSAASALQQTGSVEETIHVVPNAVDVRLAQHDSQLPMSLGDIGCRLTVVCISRLSAEKGVQFLPEIAQRVIAEIPDACFLVAGDGPLRTQLEDDRIRLSLSGRFHLLGAVDRSQVLTLLRKSDVFLLPSLTEGLPISVLEAMACGKPIVATAAGGTPELVIDGVSGLLVQPAAPSALARALVRVLADSNLRRRLGEAARNAYDEGPWTPKSSADATLKVYAGARRKWATRMNVASHQCKGTAS